MEDVNRLYSSILQIEIGGTSLNKRAKVVELLGGYIQKLDPLRPAADQISSSLKTAILQMSLKPGQIVSETEVGNLYGASRTPVREAFSELREQGLIVTLPSRGNYVSKLSISQIMGAQFIREALEVAIAEELCDTGLPLDITNEIEESLDKQRRIISMGQGSMFHELDDNFHIALADAVGRPRIARTLQREKAWLDRLRVLSLRRDEHLAVLVNDHEDIFSAIKSKDRAATRKTVRKHLRRVLDTLSDLMKEHDEFFEDE